MENYTEFTGKNVDEAISNACHYFNIDRAHLEVEIVSGGSSGIFGLVGVKKAKIKAKKRSLETQEDLSQLQEPETQPEPEPDEPLSAQEEEPQKAPDHEPQESQVPEEALENRAPKELDPELREFIRETVSNLTSSLAPESKIEINEQTDPVVVSIQESHNSELLLGQDGQTLSSLQYIANRIIAKNYPQADRIQLDTGNFLEKQGEKLEQDAMQLARRAIKAGKTMSTKPLSSYHRRIVHLALQKENKIRTKSKGEGPMKRVLIMPKTSRKKKQRSRQGQQKEQN